MDETALNIPPAKWQATVSTLKCDYIDEYVSIMAKNDWTTNCTWFRQYKDTPPGDKRDVKLDKKVRKKIALCQGPLCSYVTGYRDKLIREEQEVRS